MTRYIEVEEACSEVDKGDLLVGNNAEWAKEIIRRTSAADVVEIRRGTWEYYSSTMMECSICKRHVPVHRYEFCPHCGARMSRS